MCIRDRVRAKYGNEDPSWAHAPLIAAGIVVVVAVIIPALFICVFGVKIIEHRAEKIGPDRVQIFLCQRDLVTGCLLYTSRCV